MVQRVLYCLSQARCPGEEKHLDQWALWHREMSTEIVRMGQRINDYDDVEDARCIIGLSELHPMTTETKDEGH